jgi:hypothetical protein
VCAVPTAFFIFYGVQLVHAVITFEGEGSLGHVGMYIAAVLFPCLALLFGGFTLLAWRASKRELSRSKSAAVSEA